LHGIVSDRKEIWCWISKLGCSQGRVYRKFLKQKSTGKLVRLYVRNQKVQAPTQELREAEQQFRNAIGVERMNRMKQQHQAKPSRVNVQCYEGGQWIVFDDD